MLTRPISWSSVTVVVPVPAPVDERPVDELPAEPPGLPDDDPGRYGHEPKPRPSVTVGAGDALPLTVVADDVPTPTRTPPATPAAARPAAIATRARRVRTGCAETPAA